MTPANKHRNNRLHGRSELKESFCVLNFLVEGLSCSLSWHGRDFLRKLYKDTPNFLNRFPLLHRRIPKEFLRSPFYLWENRAEIRKHPIKSNEWFIHSEELRDNENNNNVSNVSYLSSIWIFFRIVRSGWMALYFPSKLVNGLSTSASSYLNHRTQLPAFSQWNTQWNLYTQKKNGLRIESSPNPYILHANHSNSPSSSSSCSVVFFILLLSFAIVRSAHNFVSVRTSIPSTREDANNWRK